MIVVTIPTPTPRITSLQTSFTWDRKKLLYFTHWCLWEFSTTERDDPNWYMVSPTPPGNVGMNQKLPLQEVFSPMTQQQQPNAASICYLYSASQSLSPLGLESGPCKSWDSAYGRGSPPVCCFLWPQSSLPCSCSSTDAGRMSHWSSGLCPRLHSSASIPDRIWGKIFGGVERTSSNTWGHSPPGSLQVCTTASTSSSSNWDPGCPRFLNCSVQQSFPCTPTGRGGGGGSQTPRY